MRDARRVHRHQDHRLLLVAGRGRIGLAHEDQDLAARIAGAGDPPLAAVDDVVVAVADDARLDVGRVRRGDVGLGHREARADLAGEQRLEPSPALLRRAVADQHFHVAGVGRRAVEDLGGERRPAHDLAERRVLALVSPAPYSLSGRKRFHKPAARALAFSSSTIAVGCQRSPSAICRRNVASFG